MKPRDVTVIGAAASACEIVGDDSMVIAGGIHPSFAHGQEGRLRASALVLAGGEEKLCLVSCDVLMFNRDTVDDVAKRIESECSIPFENILISATHTHHAPSTVRVHGYDRDVVFCGRLKKAIFKAARDADKKLKADQNARMFFQVGQASVGQNSRLLLGDNTIYWVGPRDDALRATGPFDPELPVIAFRKADGSLEALVFGHSTHNIGTRQGNVRSPGFCGLAAQELEEELGGTVLFLLGAAGSTHNLSLPADEMVLRMKNAVKEALSEAQSVDLRRLGSVKEEFEYRVRRFDEKAEEDAVTLYCGKRLGGHPEPTIEVFRRMRRELAPHQGEVRRTWLQAMLIGDVALVGVPGELFTSLGMEIKRRSPFRHTYIVELANDYIGYIPDNEAFDLGGYQVWTGFHSFVERGTGERMVNEAAGLLAHLRDG